MTSLKDRVETLEFKAWQAEKEAEGFEITDDEAVKYLKAPQAPGIAIDEIRVLRFKGRRSYHSIKRPFFWTQFFGGVLTASALIGLLVLIF